MTRETKKIIQKKIFKIIFFCYPAVITKVCDFQKGVIKTPKSK